MRFSVLTLVSFALVLCACSGRLDQSTSVADVRKSQVLLLHSAPHQAAEAFTSRFHGALEGSALVEFLHGRDVLVTKRISGDFDFKVEGEWYADAIELRYVPISVKGGHVEIDYAFPKP